MPEITGYETEDWLRVLDLTDCVFHVFHWVWHCGEVINGAVLTCDQASLFSFLADLPAAKEKVRTPDRRLVLFSSKVFKNVVLIQFLKSFAIIQLLPICMGMFLNQCIHGIYIVTRNVLAICAR